MSDSSYSDPAAESLNDDNSSSSSSSSSSNSDSDSVEEQVQNQPFIYQIACDQCGQKFAPLDSVFTLCDECKTKINRVEVVGTVLVASGEAGKEDGRLDDVTKKSFSSDDDHRESTIGARVEVPSDVDAEGECEQEEQEEPGFIKGIKVIEPAENFEPEHPHYQNPVFKSGRDVFDFLINVEKATEPVTVHFNSKDNPMRIHAQPTGTKSRTSAFLCVQDYHGHYEARTYYSYVNIVGYISRVKAEGFMCPAIVVENDGNGGVFDTGDRIIRLWLTRCPSKSLWALVFNIKKQEFAPIVKNLFSYMKHRFTAIHVPFEYDSTIRKKLEDFVVCSRLLYDPKREGIPLDCMHPQKPDWRILGLREAPPNGITAYQHHQNMKASLEANREGNSAATTTRQTAAAEKRKSSQHLHSNRQVVKKTKRSERAVSEPTNMSRNTGADAPVPITRGRGNKSRTRVEIYAAPVAPAPPARKSRRVEAEAEIDTVADTPATAAQRSRSDQIEVVTQKGLSNSSVQMDVDGVEFQGTDDLAFTPEAIVREGRPNQSNPVDVDKDEFQILGCNAAAKPSVTTTAHTTAIPKSSSWENDLESKVRSLIAKLEEEKKKADLLNVFNKTKHLAATSIHLRQEQLENEQAADHDTNTVSVPKWRDARLLRAAEILEEKLETARREAQVLREAEIREDILLREQQYREGRQEALKREAQLLRESEKREALLLREAEKREEELEVARQEGILLRESKWRDEKLAREGRWREWRLEIIRREAQLMRDAEKRENLLREQYGDAPKPNQF